VPDWDECVSALAAAFEAEHGVDLRPGGLTADEAAQVDTLARDKYATGAWLAGLA
jgi:lipoate-protein ligase A